MLYQWHKLLVVLSEFTKMTEKSDKASIGNHPGFKLSAGMIETTDSEVQRVLSGALAPEKSATFGLYETVMGWADKARRMKIRTGIGDRVA